MTFGHLLAWPEPCGAGKSGSDEYRESHDQAEQFNGSKILILDSAPIHAGDRRRVRECQVYSQSSSMTTRAGYQKTGCKRHHSLRRPGSVYSKNAPQSTRESSSSPPWFRHLLWVQLMGYHLGESRASEDANTARTLACEKIGARFFMAAEAPRCLEQSRRQDPKLPRGFVPVGKNDQLGFRGNRGPEAPF